MSRSGYTDDCENLGLWRGAVERALKGKRGQALLRDLAEAMDAMPDKRLIADVLEADGQYCALGVLGAKRGIDMSQIDPDWPEQVAAAFGIAPAMAQEIVYMNDEGSDWGNEFWHRHGAPDDPARARWRAMRQWIDEQLRPAQQPQGAKE